MDALLALRAQANQAGAIKLSVNDFIARRRPGCATCRK